MRVSIATQDKCIIVTAEQEKATTVAEVDKWITALRVAREWLRKELQGPAK
jgi:hypothetical protein